MGQTKRLMEEQQQLQYVALCVMCEAGTLVECEWHEGTYLDGGGDVMDAYKRAAHQLKSGEISGYSQREVTDKIQELDTLWWPDSCPHCAKM